MFFLTVYVLKIIVFKLLEEILWKKMKREFHSFGQISGGNLKRYKS